MSQQLNVNALISTEQRQQLFLALFNTDSSLLNMLNTDQHHKAFLDARNTIQEITNENVLYFIYKKNSI
jgi:hypothetical protein